MSDSTCYRHTVHGGYVLYVYPQIPTEIHYSRRIETIGVLCLVIHSSFAFMLYYITVYRKTIKIGEEVMWDEFFVRDTLQQNNYVYYYSDIMHAIFV